MHIYKWKWGARLPYLLDEAGTMEKISLNAHAKLNLSLEVVGRRDDGYHNIVSLMQGIDLCDTITIKKCPQNGTKYNLPHCTLDGLAVYLCTDASTIPTDMNNLALKGVATLLEAAKDIKPDYADFTKEAGALMIEIEKRLPVAAGIAGGSGNAAASMLGLNALMGYPFALRELMDIGAGVGADVPFSLFMNTSRNRTILGRLKGVDEASDAAWIGGIGDEVKAAEPVPRYVILANPGISVSTAEAYRAIDEIGYDESCGKGTLFVNDLEKYTLANYPEAAELKKQMEDTLDADVILMSGSGPTMAAYYTNEEKACCDAAAFAEKPAEKKGRRVWLSTTGITHEEALTQ